MNELINRLRGYVSPAFWVLLVVAFILWYLAKLSYTYTTDLTVQVDVDGVKFDVECVVEGAGTNLLAHRFYLGKRQQIPLSKLHYRYSTEAGYHERLILDPESVLDALSVKFSDIKIKSIRSIPEIDNPKNLTKE